MTDTPMVERRARIFRFGHFPEKRWGCTREEFVAANGESGTVPLGLDPIGKKHYIGKTSILDGRTGEVAFEVGEADVWATLRMPAWLDEARTEHDLKVSGQFHPVRKSLTKVDLVDTPYFHDAVVFAEEQGEVVVFEDDEPEDVAFCDSDGKHHEAYQTMHDLASHGRPGLCSGPGGKAVGFAGETDDDRLLRQMHHHAVHMGAFCPGMPDGIHQEVGMSDEIEEVEVEEEESPGEVTFSEEDMTPRERAMFRMMNQLKGEVARIGAETLEEKAVAFAASVTSGENRKALPREKQAIVEGYKRAAQVDSLLPEAITFSDESGPRQGSHLDAFKALYALRPRIALTDRKASGDEKDGDVAFTRLDVEPDRDAKAREEDEARERRRKATQDRAKAMNGSADGNRHYSG